MELWLTWSHFLIWSQNSSGKSVFNTFCVLPKNWKLNFLLSRQIGLGLPLDEISFHHVKISLLTPIIKFPFYPSFLQAVFFPVWPVDYPHRNKIFKTLRLPPDPSSTITSQFYQPPSWIRTSNSGINGAWASPLLITCSGESYAH